MKPFPLEHHETSSSDGKSCDVCAEEKAERHCPPGQKADPAHSGSRATHERTGQNRPLVCAKRSFQTPSLRSSITTAQEIVQQVWPYDRRSSLARA